MGGGGVVVEGAYIAILIVCMCVCVCVCVWYVVCLELQTDRGYCFRYIRLAWIASFGDVKTSYVFIYFLAWSWVCTVRTPGQGIYLLFNIVIDISPTKQSIN